MGFQDEPGLIRWKVHFSSSVPEVHQALTTAEGRAKFWAESAEEHDGHIEFQILSYPPYRGTVLRQEDSYFSVEYFDTVATFHLEPTGDGGTVLSLTCEVEDDDARAEMTAGWVSVLLAMKAAVDFGVDLRNQDPQLTWTQGFADN